MTSYTVRTIDIRIGSSDNPCLCSQGQLLRDEVVDTSTEMNPCSCPSVTLISVNYKEVKAYSRIRNQFVQAKDKTILCTKCEIGYAEIAEIRV